ncbi:hypothetical protein Dda_0984 [Drechslerella dactyloides]|uniref:Protein PBN1 n=1 Tax=Drechslerella dactyloides TaxID=74499 RepID=A0AAD6J672_DREDA|nr:hypothetical protein Dda_0984 [Drechslerella dactyloides]
MKRRVTFITPPGKEIPDDALRLTKDGLVVKGLKAIREEKYTFAYDELPPFAKNLVRETRELYIRFDNGKDYTSGWKGPFSSRLPLGVHAVVVPREKSQMKQLGIFLGSSSDVESLSTSYKRFTKFYTPNSSGFRSFVERLAGGVCNGVDRSCRDDIVNFNNAASVDITFDPVSQALDLTATWTTYSSNTADAKGWETLIKPYTPTGRVEIGIFSNGESPEKEEVSLRGQIAVVGEDTEFRPTAFSFPVRHHSRANIFTADFQRPTGLHPKLEVTLALGGTSPGDECTLNAYFTVPQPFFVDPYQLEDTSLMRSYGVSKIIAVEGETDLEAPAYEMKRWGATVVAELDTQDYFENRVKSHLPMEFTLPLHLRYLEPDFSKTNQTATLPWPTVFWACPAELWRKMSTSPFERKMLGYEEYFPEETYFHHLTPKLINKTQSTSSLEVPILVAQEGNIIEQATIGVIARIKIIGIITLLMLTRAPSRVDLRLPMISSSHATTKMSDPAISDWLSRNSAQIHPSVLVSKSDPGTHTISSTEPIPASTTLLSIPISATLCITNGALLQRAPALADRSQWPAMILTVMYENSLPDSKWRTYLDNLPREFDTLMYWTDDELKELEGSAVLGKVGKQEAIIFYQTEIMVFAEARKDVFEGIDMSLETFHMVGSWVMAFATDLDKPSDGRDTHADAMDEDDDDEDDEEFDSLNTYKALVPFANFVPGDCELANCEFSPSESSVSLIATANILANASLYIDPGPFPRSDLLRRLGAFQQSSADHDVVEIDSTLIISVAGRAVPEMIRDARIERLVEEDLLEDSYDIEADGAIPSEMLVVIQAFMADDMTFQSYVDQEKFPKAKKDSKTRDIVVEIVEKRREGYKTTSEEDVALLRSGEALSRRKRMAVEVRLGEKEILRKMENAVSGWADVEPAAADSARNRKRVKRGP